MGYSESLYLFGWIVGSIGLATFIVVFIVLEMKKRSEPAISTEPAKKKMEEAELNACCLFCEILDFETHPESVFQKPFAKYILAKIA